MPIIYLLSKGLFQYLVQQHVLVNTISFQFFIFFGIVCLIMVNGP